ncbi:MAG: hypothetical protein EXQ99_07400 [Alphaproteobacteria bacterium]|nr:hypothetical protein [Alphaproteobacteria bacterium]
MAEAAATRPEAPANDNATALQPAEPHDLARAIVRDAAARYAALRRARIDGFVDRHFSLGGALELNRHAFGWDLVRAPTNISLAWPELARPGMVRLAKVAGARRVAARIDRRRLVLDTDVAREIEWRLFRELFELPYDKNGRELGHDAFAEEILADPRIAALKNDALHRIRLEALGQIDAAIEAYGQHASRRPI